MFFIENHAPPVVSGLLTIAAIVWLRWLRHWHIGFGVDLRMRKSDGTVWVASRLLGYPAAEHGIHSHTRLVSVNGEPMLFGSGGQFLDWFKTHKPKRGREEVWVVAGMEGETEARMLPRLVTTSIPSYWDPNQELVEVVDLRPDPFVRRGLRRCRKTGELLSTTSLSDYAIRQIIT